MRFFGRIVEKSQNWYPCKCNVCGWIGSSQKCGTDWNGEDGDVYCPRCGSPDTDGYNEYYPMFYLLTDLISRFKAWIITKRETKHWNNFYEKYNK